jgi:hypothetical protein
MFGTLDKVGILRVSREHEEAGLDSKEHGGGAYSGADRAESFDHRADTRPAGAVDLEATLKCA